MSLPTSILEFSEQGKGAVAKLLARLETPTGPWDMVDLLDQLHDYDTGGRIIGLTGPPGVGKSTLINALIGIWRQAGHRVGVIAVDPSSRRTGGALLGDRTRLKTDPSDEGVFVRSMAARDRLGGLSFTAIAAADLMTAFYDRVIVESVGIGQSEADIALIADTIVLCVQPGAGDSLQYMKAGIMEMPDIFAVTKADQGNRAIRATGEIKDALGLTAERTGTWKRRVVAVSATDRTGLEDLVKYVSDHLEFLGECGRLGRNRDLQRRSRLTDFVRVRFGTAGQNWLKKQQKNSSDRIKLYGEMRNLEQILSSRFDENCD